MRKRPQLTTILFVILLFAGLMVMAFPTLSDMYARWQMGRELEKYQQVVESGYDGETSLFEEAESYNKYLATKDDQFKLEPGEFERIRSLLNPLGNHMMGIVSIPKIGEELPIYQGIEEKQLQSGAGWFYGSSLPTGGTDTHCVITAHNGLVKARLFTDIEKLEKGDLFFLKVMSREMAYEVDQILVTEPEDFSALVIVPGEDLVTLYTCTPYGINTHRLLVRGHRTAMPGWVQLDTAGLPCIWLVIGAVLLALLIGGILLCKRRKHKSHQINKPHKRTTNKPHKRTKGMHSKARRT